jgi:hypothetical protein
VTDKERTDENSRVKSAIKKKKLAIKIKRRGSGNKKQK